MKIAITIDVIYPFTIGGSEIRNYEVLKRLAKRGHDVHIYGAKFWQGEDIIEIDGIKIHGVLKYNKLYGNSGRRSVIEPIKLSLRLFFALLKEKYDLIDNASFTYFNCYATKLVSLIKKTPLVFTWQQYFGDYLIGYLGKTKGIIAKIIEKQTIKLAKFNIVVSNAVKEDLIKGGMEEEKIWIIHNGADIKTIKNVKASDEKYDLIFAGRLTYQKNLELLIYAIKFLKHDFPKIRVCIIGDGNEKENLKEIANKLNINENLKFIDGIKDKEELFGYMKSASVFALPSRFEGFPLVVTEANACGLPLVVANAKWNRERDFRDWSGLITEPTPEAFANGIKHLLKDKEMWIKMKEEGIKKAQQFDWDKIAEATELYYSKIIKNYKKVI